MSDTTDSTEQLPTVPGTDGYAPSVDDDNEMTLLMHKDFAQEVASNKDGTLPNPERNKDSVFECVLESIKDSVGASFAQQPAAPEAHWSPGVAGSSIIAMLEVIERNFTKNLAEPPLAEDEVEIGYQKVTQENNVTSALKMYQKQKKNEKTAKEHPRKQICKEESAHDKDEE